jgi:hypothetical protein
VTDATQALGRGDFYSPGSILSNKIDTINSIAKWVDQHSIVWSQSSTIFDIIPDYQPGQITVVGKYRDTSNP